MKEVQKIYKSAPPLGKIMLIGLLIFILILAGVLVKKGIENVTKPKDTLDAASDELQILANTTGEIPNYSEAQFKNFADGLEKAFSGLGTDESAVENYFRYMQNKADVLQLIKSFGIRDYTDDKFLMFNVKPYNLSQWIVNEMDPEEIKEYINNPLSAKNINYSF